MQTLKVATTSSNEVGTVVPLSESPASSTPSLHWQQGRGEVVPAEVPFCLPPPGQERYGDLATPLTNIPVHVGADEISLTAGFHPPRSPESPQRLSQHRERGRPSSEQAPKFRPVHQARSKE